MIFGDNTLRLMAREYPESLDDLRGISGIGEKKMAEFGEVFVAEVKSYLATYPKVKF